MRLIALSSVAMILSSGSVFAQQACESYTVQPGDTLHKISRRAFDGSDRFHDDIYRLNRNTIGPNPNVIQVGMQIQIVCPPGSENASEDGEDEPQVVAEEAAVEEPVTVETPVAEPEPVADPEPEVEEVVAEEEQQPEPTTPTASTENTVTEQPQETAVVQGPSDPNLLPTMTLVTANGFAPYTDESLGTRGMMVEFIETAMLRAAPDLPYEIIFVNDRAAHQELLLPRHAVDASFPWSMPDCSMSASMMTASEKSACDNFIFTESFYEIVDGFFVTHGSEYESVFDFGDLVGATICRPEGYTISHLEAEGLVPPAVELVRPARAEECFEKLIFGEADVVSMDLNAGESVISEMNITYDVTTNANLFSLRSLNVVFMKSNPNAQAFVDILNQGLSNMQQSGEWYDIGTRVLREQMEAAAMN